MSEFSVSASAPDSLAAFTEEQRKGRAIAWYRCPVPPRELKALHQRSDLLGAAQTLGYLAMFAGTCAAALYAFFHWPWWATLLLVYLHGTVASFLINGVHELGHGTVFKTKEANVFFCHVLAFLGFINHEFFQSSHARHHRYTLHPPDDLEVELPMGAELLELIRTGFFNFTWFRHALTATWRIARGRFAGDWETTLYPPGDAARARPAIRWARVLLIGHGLILVASIATGWWIVPVLLSLGQFYGGWLHNLCNTTQHIGLQDNVDDFRLCCRTFTVNPFVQCLYWHMNFHIEHHMFAAVPCYRLARLHRLIRADLPPTTHGLIATWREIFAILRRQRLDRAYQHVVPLPARG